MGLMDSVKKLSKNKNQIAKVAKGVDKATDMIDKKTGGKHHDKLQKLDDAAAKIGGGKPAAGAAKAPAAETDQPG